MLSAKGALMPLGAVVHIGIGRRPCNRDPQQIKALGHSLHGPVSRTRVKRFVGFAHHLAAFRGRRGGIAGGGIYLHLEAAV